MAKIRTVKPELFRHESLFEAEQSYRLPLRLAFIGLFSCCDREGRFRWEPRSLKLDILPYDDIDFTEVLNALWQAGFIKKYQYHHKYYGHIPSWHQHQSINKHEPTSKYPNPDQCIDETINEYDHRLSSLQCTSQQRALSDTHRPAYASQNTVTTTDSIKKCSTQIVPDIENDETFLLTQAIQNQVSTVSKTEPIQPTISRSSKSHSNHKNFTNQPPEPTFNNLIPLSNPQNLSSNSSNTAMHMHAPALQEPLSAVQMPASLEVEVEMEVEVEVEVETVPTKTEVKKKQGGGANPNIVAQARRCRANTASISAVFDHWKAAMQHPNAVLDKKRTGLIRAALQQGYTVDQLCEAISGCAKTPHNLGHNEHNQRYDGLHIILRDADQIERFIRNCHNPPQLLTPADQLLRANTSVGENWLKHSNPPGDSRHGKSR